MEQKRRIFYEFTACEYIITVSKLRKKKNIKQNLFCLLINMYTI